MKRILGAVALCALAVVLARGAGNAQTVTGPSVVPSYPTPAPAPTGIVLKGVTIIRMPDMHSTRAHLSRSERKAQPHLARNIGESVSFSGTPEQEDAATQNLYAQRMKDAQRALATARTVQAVQLRRPR